MFILVNNSLVHMEVSSYYPKLFCCVFAATVNLIQREPKVQQPTTMMYKSKLASILLLLHLLLCKCIYFTIYPYLHVFGDIE